MAPWDATAADARTGVGAEKAFSFLSKSISEVQKSAESDIMLIKARVKSFKNLSEALDKEWESLKIPAVNNLKNSGKILRMMTDTSKRTAGTTISSAADFGFLKSLKPTLSEFHGFFTDSEFQSQYRDDSTGMDLRLRTSPFSKDVDSGLDLFSRNARDGLQNGRPSSRKITDRRMVVRDRQKGSKRKKSNRKLKPASVDDWMDDWEPFRRVKESVKESLQELESTAATSKTPSEFFENVKNTEFYENVKKNLKLSSSADTSKEQYGLNVAPLDVPELLENLVRQSEPLLDHLGVKKEKVRDLIRSCKREDQQLFRPASKMRKDSTKNQDNLDLRIASVCQSTGYRYKGGLWSDHEDAKDSHDQDCRRNIAIVTTASLPWMTGTAVNPLFRAAFLAKTGKQNVTLLVPWLSKNDQQQVYPNRMTFDSPEDQESYVRDWVEARVGFKSDFKIAFYPGKFSVEKRSILAAGDISEFIPNEEADVAVLEEPEHLTWYYHGKRWTDKFQHVVGIVHTNYLEYVKREKNGAVQAFFLEHINNWMVRAYCNKVLRLSAATQELPKSSVMNVHGVGPRFLETGKRLASEAPDGKPTFSKGAYYLGKMIWGKGYRELVDLFVDNKDLLSNVELDVFGSGEDSHEVHAEAQQNGLRMKFYQGRDHGDKSLHDYKIFINPSLSDVVCTTTAEALAMGKIVVCADHPSNDFFRSFPNCYIYRTPEEFVEKVQQAMSSEPEPLSPELQHLLSWEAATDRFIDSAGINKLPPKGAKKSRPKEPVLLSEGVEQKTMTLSTSTPDLAGIVDKGLYVSHYLLAGIDPWRSLMGALPETKHIDAQHCKDLGLPPPHVQRPVYGW
uniref:digalactosyldiacylglycerol synthase n=2 Tax=Physcomitrium patens TaxID=3218 RepID=A0A7I4C3Y7_PHYPA